MVLIDYSNKYKVLSFHSSITGKNSLNEAVIIGMIIAFFS